MSFVVKVDVIMGVILHCSNSFTVKRVVRLVRKTVEGRMDLFQTELLDQFFLLLFGRFRYTYSYISAQLKIMFVGYTKLLKNM